MRKILRLTELELEVLCSLVLCMDESLEWDRKSGYYRDNGRLNPVFERSGYGAFQTLFRKIMTVKGWRENDVNT